MRWQRGDVSPGSEIGDADAELFPLAQVRRGTAADRTSPTGAGHPETRHVPSPVPSQRLPCGGGSSATSSGSSPAAVSQRRQSRHTRVAAAQVVWQPGTRQNVRPSSGCSAGNVSTQVPASQRPRPGTPGRSGWLAPLTVHPAVAGQRTGLLRRAVLPAAEPGPRASSSPRSCLRSCQVTRAGHRIDGGPQPRRVRMRVACVEAMLA